MGRGITALSVWEYSNSCRSAFRIAAQEFEVYMDERLDMTYSLRLAQQWVNDHQECGTRTKSKAQEISWQISSNPHNLQDSGANRQDYGVCGRS